MMNADKKFELQKHMQAKNDAAAKLFEEVLNSEQFPIEKLSAKWKCLVKLAISKSAPIHHRLPLKEFAKVVAADPNEDLSLFQFGVLSNSLETVSPDTLGLLDEDYQSFIDEAVQHVEWYQKRVSELREEIQLRVDSDFKLKEAALNGSGSAFKPPIGKA